MSTDIVSSIILGVAGITVTFFYSHHSRRLEHDKMMKELFSEFNKRYSSLNQYLSLVREEYSTSELFKERASDQLKDRIIDYFNLCAEEYYWYRKGRIDKDVWISWQAGMNYWYNHVITIKDLWKEEIQDSGETSYYMKKGDKGFFVEI